MNTSYGYQEQEWIEIAALGTISILIFANIAYIFWISAISCRDKKRKKAWLTRKQKYDEQVALKTK